MTEKHYGGEGGKTEGKLAVQKKSAIHLSEKRKSSIERAELKDSDDKDLEDCRKAGRIAKQAVEYARVIIKKGMPLLEIAEKIENKIIELGGKPAFPVNLCINGIAAHYTPSYNDETCASGLLKVDIGVHVNGAIADTAFSLDLENNSENKKLIEASEYALKNALELISKMKSKTELGSIGKVIQQATEKFGFSPIKNLCGHELGSYVVHAGCTIPNYDNGNANVLENGIYAIEPFATAGQGVVYEGKPSGIYKLQGRKAIRDSLARQILSFVEEEYKTLPFCERWIVKKFSARALLSLKLLEQAGILHHFPQLVEKSHMPVSQAENTIVIGEGKAEVLV